jgi:hypothetical protein
MRMALKRANYTKGITKAVLRPLCQTRRLGYQLARTAPLLNRGRPAVLWGDSWTPTWPSCRGTQKAGGCHQCVVRVRERCAAKAGSAGALLM